MIYFLKLTLPQYYFNHSFLQQAFTRKSKNSCRFTKFQEYSRFCEYLGYSWKFLNLHGLLDFLVKACRYWPLEYSRISMKFMKVLPCSLFKYRLLNSWPLCQGWGGGGQKVRTPYSPPTHFTGKACTFIS